MDRFSERGKLEDSMDVEVSSNSIVGELMLMRERVCRIDGDGDGDFLLVFLGKSIL